MVASPVCSCRCCNGSACLLAGTSHNQAGLLQWHTGTPYGMRREGVANTILCFQGVLSTQGSSYLAGNVCATSQDCKVVKCKVAVSLTGESCERQHGRRMDAECAWHQQVVL